MEETEWEETVSVKVLKNTPTNCYLLVVIALVCKETPLSILVCNIISVYFYCIVLKGRVKSSLVWSRASKSTVLGLMLCIRAIRRDGNRGRMMWEDAEWIRAAGNESFLETRHAWAFTYQSSKWNNNKVSVQKEQLARAKKDTARA